MERERIPAKEQARRILAAKREQQSSDLVFIGNGYVPLVAVPTLYRRSPSTPSARTGFNMVIFANHPMRAAIRAIEDTLAREKNAAAVDTDIAKVDHEFELVETQAAIELEEIGA